MLESLSENIFTTLLWGSLILGLLGWGVRCMGFLKRKKAFKAQRISTGLDFNGAAKNAIAQPRLAAASRSRWAWHFMVVVGFVYLTLFHAMDELISFRFFGYYQPTLDPHQFFRNLAGIMVVLGCAGFIRRRMNDSSQLCDPVSHRRIPGVGKGRDFVLILLVLLAVATGFLLESVKIVSEPIFMEMVDDYADLEEGPELSPLKALWQEEYRVVFEDPPEITAEMLEAGNELNEEFCVDCHSRPKSAFVSNSMAIPLGQKFQGTGRWLNQARADRVLYWVHCLSVFALLVFMPFTRLGHMVMIPFAAAMKRLTPEGWARAKSEDPMVLALSPAALAACTRCGLCSTVCNVYPNAVTGSENALPHNKIQWVTELVNGRGLDGDALQSLYDGNAQCTHCENCTRICPSAIDLQGIWLSLPKRLEEMGAVGMADRAANLPFGDRLHPVPDTEEADPGMTTELTRDISAFESCVQCTVCSNVCPVTAHAGPGNDITPQQVMNLLRLGNPQAARASRMVRNCLSCYSCQEHCPQQIPVADIMLELRQKAVAQAQPRNHSRIEKGEE
ncbi:MAG: 4Fe-4S dicluster domain-containing protein [Desulfobacterales bacterium]|nr:4Fe-4S dicluster domain-containing protein [Desulfobacterales bacterium]